MSHEDRRKSSLEEIKNQSSANFGITILSPTVELRNYKSNLILGILLGFVAGTVNSVSFLGLGGYVSHVSGHATRAAVEYSQKHIDIAFTYASAIIFFILGAIITTMLLKGHSIQSKHAVMGFPLLIEGIILLVVCLSANQAGIVTLTQDDPINIGYIYLLSLAMGMQNALVTYVSGAKVRTTHMTGLATDIGIALGAAFIHGVKHWGALKKLKNIKEVSIFISEFRRQLFFLHTCILLSFAFGAVIGTFGYYKFSFLTLIGPVTILLLISFIDMVFHYKNWRRRI